MDMHVTLPEKDVRDAGELREAFELFSQTSARLAETYTELQGQVARLSAELAAANGELARRERLSLLGEVAAKLAHQLRTPLAAALLYVGHLGRPGLGEVDRLRFAEKTRTRLHYLERLVQDMLLFVKGQQGVASRFILRELVEDLVQVMEPQAHPRGVRLAVNLAEPDLEMEADRQAVQGALINLIENAVQASPDGAEVVIEVVSGGAFLGFHVRDAGPGIDPAEHSRLFEPFYTTRGEGSGLGLAIVKQAAEAHGGWVELQSEPGAGSVFSLYLPRRLEGRPA